MVLCKDASFFYQEGYHGINVVSMTRLLKNEVDSMMNLNHHGINFKR